MKFKTEEKKITPPYLSYKTFLTFMDRLKTQGIPARIDRSVVGTFSGAIQGQLFSALRYLNLMNEAGSPTEQLRKLVNTIENNRPPILKDILTISYPFLFGDKNDLNTITLKLLQERFEAAGSSGDTTRKSVKFFLMAAKDAGIELSPYIKKSRIRLPRSNGTTKGKKQKEEIRNEVDSKKHPYLNEQINKPNWQLLLEKFPSFDPEWSDEVKTKWFEGFSRLMDELKK